MKEFVLLIVGFVIGIFLSMSAFRDYHTKITERGYMSVDNKLYEVKLKGIK